MARWDRQRYEEDLRELIRQAEVVGIEEATKSFASDLLADYPPEAISSQLDFLRAKHRIKGDDAITAFRVYEAHILGKFPRPIQILWALFKRLAPRWVVDSSPDRVVIRTPSSTGRILCPVLNAADGDLEKAKPICEALFRYDAFYEPLSVLVPKAVNPGIHWEIEEFRERPDFPCYYAIVLDPEDEKSGSKN